MDALKWITSALAALTTLIDFGHLEKVLPSEWPVELLALMTTIAAVIAALQKKAGGEGAPQPQKGE